MELKLNITKIVILQQGYGLDTVWLKCAGLAPSMWPWDASAIPDLKLECAAGTGPVYVEKQFPGIPVEIIEV